MDVTSLFSMVRAFSSARVLCLGDIMLDSFDHGHATRVSPEAPIPVFCSTHVQEIAGGAANVAQNIVALGAQCTLVGLIGDDSVGTSLSQILIEEPRLKNELITVNGRQTTHKKRHIANGQQILRVDTEMTHPISGLLEKQVVKKVLNLIDGHQVVVISDYSKGLLTVGILKTIIESARSLGIPVLIDPKASDFRRYSGATLLKSNLLEAQVALGSKGILQNEISDEDAIDFCKTHNIEHFIITRGGEGISLYSRLGLASHLDSTGIEVCDTVGAGDTVLATLACCIAAGGPVDCATYLANQAASIVVAKPNTSVVESEELLRRLVQHEGAVLADPKALSLYISDQRRHDKKIASVQGDFDILSSDHISFFRKLKANHDILIVGINEDLFSEERKIINEPKDRAMVICGLRDVDLVFLITNENIEDFNYAISEESVFDESDVQQSL